MPITAQQLLQIFPNAGQVAGVFVPVLNTAMSRYQIVGTKRIAAFLAQVGHESGHLTRLVENLNYTAVALRTTWPSRFDAGLPAQPHASPSRSPTLPTANVWATPPRAMAGSTVGAA